MQAPGLHRAPQDLQGLLRYGEFLPVVDLESNYRVRCIGMVTIQVLEPLNGSKDVPWKLLKTGLPKDVLYNGVDYESTIGTYSG